MVRFLTAGESHGPALTAIIEGIPADLSLTVKDIQPDLTGDAGVMGGAGA